jgi:rhodanese-related sulfurtransferase
MQMKHLRPLGLFATATLTIAAPARADQVPSTSHGELVRAVKAKKVVLLDVNGTESYKAGAQAARKLGYTNVRHYSPGIMGWNKSSAPVAKG